ncbi:hypothetical protein NC01_09875, partial [Streptococcus uberis]
DGTKDTVTVTVHVTPTPDKKTPTLPTHKSSTSSKKLSGLQTGSKASTLPATSDEIFPFFTPVALAIITSAGLIVSKKRRR